MHKPELLVPASSLEVLKIATVSEQTLFISEERLLGFVPRPAIFQKKRWRRELHLPMSMV